MTATALFLPKPLSCSLQVKEEQKHQAEAATFKARPNTAIHKEPFMPKKENRSVLGTYDHNCLAYLCFLHWWPWTTLNLLDFFIQLLKCFHHFYIRDSNILSHSSTVGSLPISRGRMYQLNWSIFIPPLRLTVLFFLSL